MTDSSREALSKNENVTKGIVWFARKTPETLFYLILLLGMRAGGGQRSVRWFLAKVN